MNEGMFIVPQLLEGMGPINAAAKKMAEQMETDDPREVFRRINSGEWVVKPATVSTALGSFIIDNRTLGEMITAGHYDWVSGDITSKRFPITSEAGEYEYKLFHFDRDIASENAKEEIERDGWEVAKIEHLLAFAEKNPDEQRKYPVLALGSVASVCGYRLVPYLDRYDSERGLDLGWFGNGWDPIDRFLAVRKVSAA